MNNQELSVALLLPPLPLAMPTLSSSSLVLLLLAPDHATALMFHSTAVTKQWDTWGFVENGTWYAYYLITEQSPGEGFGVATSTDAVHWHDHGYVWHGPSWTEHRWWEGTSSVWRAPDYNKTGRYLINYSEYPNGGNQTITFAESYDLIHWSRPPPLNSTYFPIDTSKGYTAPGRWDTIYSVPVPGKGQENPRDGYPRYGFWTASPKNGSWGAGITHDGVHWQALPSPKMLPADVGGEIGAIEFVPYSSGSKPGGLWVAMLGYGWPRTMLTYTASDPLGPYTRATRNVNSINGSCYFSRFLRGPNMEILISHQTWTYRGTHVAYISPYKLAHLDDDGTFRLKWYVGNEHLKGAPLSTSLNQTQPQYFYPTSDASEGALLEAAFSMPSTSTPSSSWPGFLIDQGEGLALSVVLQPDGLVAIGDYRTFADAVYAKDGVALPAQAAADWLVGGGASTVPTRDPKGNGTDLRSGGPGGTGTALLAHPLDSKGHVLEEVKLRFHYVAGYTPSPGKLINGSTLSVALVDAHNGSHIATLCTTAQLSNYSFDHFTGESPPVYCNSSSGLSIAWTRQMAVKLILTNNQRNVQIPLSTLSLNVKWGAPQPGPYTPTPVPPTTSVRQRWSRDYDLGAPGASVPARLLSRRGMLELYLFDYLYPVFCDVPGTGRFGVTNHSTVGSVKWWRMSLPVDEEWDAPSRQPAPDSEEVVRAKFGLRG